MMGGASRSKTMSNKTFVELFGFDHPAARLSEAVVIIFDMQHEYLDGAVRQTESFLAR